MVHKTKEINDAVLGWLLILALLIPDVIFLIAEQRTLKAVKKENRLMYPGLVWLQLVPLFGQLWQFLVVVKISGSIKNELTEWNSDSILGFSDATAVESTGKRPTLFIGIAYCLLNAVGITGNLFIVGGSSYPAISLIIFAGMVCWIIYWVQLASYKRRLRRKAA